MSIQLKLDTIAKGVFQQRYAIVTFGKNLSDIDVVKIHGVYETKDDAEKNAHILKIKPNGPDGIAPIGNWMSMPDISPQDMHFPPTIRILYEDQSFDTTLTSNMIASKVFNQKFVVLTFVGLKNYKPAGFKIRAVYETLTEATDGINKEFNPIDEEKFSSVVGEVGCWTKMILDTSNQNTN